MPSSLAIPSLGRGLLLLAVLATSSAAEPPVLRNTDPARSPRVVELEELWRAGGPDSDLIFGTVTEAAADSAGNVYVLDTQLCHVQVFSPTGQFLGTLSREGDGPGEVRRPRDVAFLPDGSLGLLELFPAKFVRLTTTGEPRGTLIVGVSTAPEGGFTSAGQAIYRGGTFLVSGQYTAQNPGGQRREMFLLRLSDAGEEQVRFREATLVLDFENLRFVERELQPAFHLAMAVGPDGRVYVPAAWDRYAIEVFRPDGVLDRVIERTFENRRRSELELRRINALYDAAERSSPYGMTRAIEPCPAVISDLEVDASGNLWVLHSRSGEGRHSGVMQRYDVFDPQGRYLQEVSVACEGDPEFDGLEFLPDGRVLLIKGYAQAGMARTDQGNVALGEEEETGPMEIICYRCGLLGL